MTVVARRPARAAVSEPPGARRRRRDRGAPTGRPRAGARPDERAGAQSRGRRGSPAAALRRAPRPARPPPDRRGQAAVAVGRRDRRAGDDAPSPRAGLRARRRGRDLASCASRTGSAARSPTCAAVRAAVVVPVLAKEFVVDPRQLPLLRAAGADAVLLLAVLHPAAAWPRLVDAALDLGLEPLVEAHDERELDRALATRARIDRPQQPRPAHARRRSRAGRPAPRLGPGRPAGDRRVRRPRPATVAGWRAVGFDARARRRGADAGRRPGRGRRARSSRPGAFPDDPAVAGPAPVREDLRHHRRGRRPGRDPRRRRRDRAQPRPRHAARAVARRGGRARPARPGGELAGTGRPRIVAITADAAPARLAEIVAAVDPDAIQLSGDESPELVGALARPAWKVLHLPADERRADDGRRRPPAAVTSDR